MFLFSMNEIPRLDAKCVTLRNCHTAVPSGLILPHHHLVVHSGQHFSMSVFKISAFAHKMWFIRDGVS